MTDPTQPPAVPEALLKQWITEAAADPHCVTINCGHIARSAAAWLWTQHEEEVREAEQRRADAELEACCDWLRADQEEDGIANALRAARRPAPPTLREQALAALRKRLTDPGVLMSGENRDAMELALQALQEGAEAERAEKWE